jgi:hypothetical protein
MSDGGLSEQFPFFPAHWCTARKFRPRKRAAPYGSMREQIHPHMVMLTWSLLDGPDPLLVRARRQPACEPSVVAWLACVAVGRAPSLRTRAAASGVWPPARERATGLCGQNTAGRLPELVLSRACGAWAYGAPPSQPLAHVGSERVRRSCRVASCLTNRRVNRMFSPDYV